MAFAAQLRSAVGFIREDLAATFPVWERAPVSCSRPTLRTAGQQHPWRSHLVSRVSRELARKGRQPVVL